MLNITQSRVPAAYRILKGKILALAMRSAIGVAASVRWRWPCHLVDCREGYSKRQYHSDKYQFDMQFHSITSVAGYKPAKTGPGLQIPAHRYFIFQLSVSYELSDHVAYFAGGVAHFACAHALELVAGNVCDGSVNQLSGFLLTDSVQQHLQRADCG